MIEEEKVNLRISVVVINLASILGCLLILWTFWRVQRLTQNPGKIIMRISFLQLLFSILLIISQFYYYPEKDPYSQQSFAVELNKRQCNGIAFFSLTIGILFNYYNIIFVYYLFQILQQKSNQSLEKNFSKYEFVAILISVLYSLAFLLTDQFAIGYLGDCNVKMYSVGVLINSALSLIILFVLLVMIIIIKIKLYQINSIQFKQEIYNIETTKFKQKYLKNFLNNNVLYILVFIIVRLIPVIYFNLKLNKIILTLFLIKNYEDHIFVLQDSTLILVSIGGVLLFIVRANEPIVKKHIKRQFICCYNHKSLNEKLILKNKQSQSLADPLIDNYSERGSLEITMVDNISNSLGQTKTSSKLGSLFTKRVRAELAFILMTVREAIKTEIPNKKFILDVYRPYNFLQIKLKKFGVKNNYKGIEAHFLTPMDKGSSITSTSYNDSFWEQLIEIDNGQEKYPIQLQCFYYASDYLLSLLKILNIGQAQILESLKIDNNMRRLTETTSYGQQYITEDGLISIDFITRKQKTLLTREGGLLKIFKIWSDIYNETKITTTHIPLILGVMSILMENNKCITICVRVNWIWLEYPISQESWEKRQWKKKFDKKNVIGWIEVSPDFINKRFLASTTIDGKFQIKLQESDFKLTSDDQIQLIDNLQRDLKAMVILGTQLSLTFVYFKFNTQRLISLINHEQNAENIMESKMKGILETEVIINTPNSTNSSGVIGKYWLDSHIGYVKVFFDQIFYQDEINAMDMQLECEKLVQRVTEII